MEVAYASYWTHEKQTGGGDGIIITSAGFERLNRYEG